MLECAGVVTEVGAEVAGVEVGDDVIVYPVTGAYADCGQRPRPPRGVIQGRVIV
jgi:NADPH:quinone reductase-like Zn-dependent oxidoreductase